MNAMNDPHDRALQQFAKAQLEQHAAALDERSRIRLRAARHEALSTTARPLGLRLGWAGATVAAALTLTLFFWQQQTPQTSESQDAPFMAQSDEHDLRENWEFYEWLDTVEQTQPATRQPSHSSFPTLNNAGGYLA